MYPALLSPRCGSESALTCHGKARQGKAKQGKARQGIQRGWQEVWDSRCDPD